MATIDTNITRNLRTIDDWKEYFRTKIPELNPSWTNTSDEDLGMVLVTLISAIGDQLNFRYDMSILEAFLGSARERNNVQALLNLIGYTLSTYETSSVEVTIQYPELAPAPFDTPYEIPRFSYVIKESNPNIKYYTLEPLTIYAGALGIRARFYEGTLVTDYKTSRDVDKYGRLYLTQTLNNIASNGIVVTYDSNIVLERVTDIYLSTEPKQFELLVDTYGQYYIQFDATWRDYINQNVPLEIKIDYLATSGLAAQVQANYFDVLVGGTGPNEVEVFNTENATGYLEPETIENARIEAPKYARTMKTAVTVQDYQDLIITDSDEFIDAMAVDLNYNGVPVAFTSLEDARLSMLNSANAYSVPTICIDYIFDILSEILNADLQVPEVLAALEEKYEESGILGTYTVETAQTALLNDDFFTVAEEVADNIIDIANGPVPTMINTWQSAVLYAIGDVVVYDDVIYECNTSHTSTAFMSDIAKWTEVSNANAYSTLKEILGNALIDTFEITNLLDVQDLIQYVETQNAQQNILNLDPYELLIVVLTENYILTDAQKQHISEILDAVKMATIQYTLQAPSIQNVDIYLTAAVSSAASNNTNVISHIETLVDAFFNTLLIGQGFRLSQLLAYIHNNYALSGLSYIIPSTTTIAGTTSVSVDCTKLEIVKNNKTPGSVLNIEVINV